MFATPSFYYLYLKKNFDFSIGVDLFFVISGFVITQSFSNSLSSGRANLFNAVVAFWIKRIFRLLPAAFFWLLIVVLYYLCIGYLWDGQSFNFKPLIPTAAAFANILNFYGAYCAANPTDPFWCGTYYFTGHYWSLSLEEQFYLIFPLLYLSIQKRLLIWLLVLLIGIHFFWFRPVWSYAWCFRIDGFCWGILLAMVPASTQNASLTRILKNKVTALTFSTALLFLLLFLASRVQGFGKEMEIYGVGLVALISAALVFIATQDSTCFSNCRLYRNVMLYIGSRSYSLYITHLIIFEIVRNLYRRTCGDLSFSGPEKYLANICMVLSALAITFIASELTYRQVELNFRLKGRNIAKSFMLRRANFVKEKN